jgi:hypothetical protein
VLTEHEAQQIIAEAADQEGADPLADEGDLNSPSRPRPAPCHKKLFSFELHLQAATKQMPITP